MIGNFMLGSFLAYNSTLLALKMIYVKIEDQMKNNILKDGLYHLTSEENANKIMEDGHIRPSGVVASLGAKKTFFFAGVPSIDLIRENVAGLAEQFEWTAINVRPDENDLSNYRIRKFDDNSVVCKGKCSLEEGKVRKVSLVLDLDQEGIPYIREKTPEEIENGYEPSEELKQKFKIGNNALVVKRNLMKAYFKKPYQLISRLISSIKSKKEKDELESTISEESYSNVNEDRKAFLNKYRVSNYRQSKISSKKREKNIDREIDEL